MFWRTERFPRRTIMQNQTSRNELYSIQCRYYKKCTHYIFYKNDKSRGLFYYETKSEQSGYVRLLTILIITVLEIIFIIQVGLKIQIQAIDG